MADGFRITESGDLRVSETGDSRVTERYYTGSVALTVSSSVSGQTTVKASGLSNLSNVGSVLFAGFANRPAATRLNASSTVLTDGDLKAKGVISVTSTSTQNTVGLRIRPAETALESLGTLASEAGFKFSGGFSSTVTGTLGLAPKFTGVATFDTDQADIVRLTESGDIRVTEDGLDTRVCLNVNPNVVYGNFTADGVYYKFSAVAYIKQNGVWEEFDPYVKWAGDWELPEAIYKKMPTTSSWKRVY